MAEREAKKQKTQKDAHESSELCRQDLALRMSMKDMSLDSIADLLKMEATEVVRILEAARLSQDSGSSDSSGHSTQGLELLVKRLMTDPPELCCPIAHALMEDPVVAGDGFTYERCCIEGCLKERAASPMTGAPIETHVLHPNQKVKSEILSFKEKTIIEILGVSQDLPAHFASQLLQRAEEFIRVQLPDAAAQRKLSTLLLLRIKLPGVNKGDIVKEIVPLLVKIQDEDQLHQFLSQTGESDLLTLLPNLDEEMVTRLHNATQSSAASCRSLIDKVLACRLARRLGDDERLQKMWKLLLANWECEEFWAKGAAVVLAAFIERLSIPLKDIDSELLNLARAYVEDQQSAIFMAEHVFKYDLGISTSQEWPPRGAAKILAEEASRLSMDDDVFGEKLELLVRAHGIDGQDKDVRKSLTEHLHQCMLQEGARFLGQTEGLFLKLLLEDNVEVPEDVLPTLSLEEWHLEELSADHLILLAKQLGSFGRCVDAARVAVDAAKKFSKNDEETKSHHALLQAFRWDRTNIDASDGLATTVATILEETQLLRERCQELEKGHKEIEDRLINSLKELKDSSRDAHTGMSFVWDLSGYDFSTYSKGDTYVQESDKFQIFPGINAHFELNPKGASTSSPGWASLYVRLDKPAHLQSRVKAGQTDIALDGSFAANRSLGWINFMRISEVNTASITINVLSVRPAQSSVLMVAPGCI